MSHSSSNGPADVVVVGSINMDLVVRSDRIPAPGQTVLGRDFATIPGGKGANQAVAVARLGGRCAMVGRVGEDDFGQRLLVGLSGNRVDCGAVIITEGLASGVALIMVGPVGENAICVASGANWRMTPEDLDAAAETIRAARVCLLQLELPVETVAHAIRLAADAGVETILDTAPVPPDGVPSALFAADIVSPNAPEAEAITGETLRDHRQAKAVAAELATRGARHVVLKLGERGAVCFDGEHFQHVPAHRISPVDTTAAGDAFMGALAVARARGEDLCQAVQYANAAGAAACRKFGAQPAMPTPGEVSELLGA